MTTTFLLLYHSVGDFLRDGHEGIMDNYYTNKIQRMKIKTAERSDRRRYVQKN